ncbi:hypothetical protein [Microbacterium sp. BR1]|uniref:hypothetical protein n=1 Tax=Microbacterium sp. BR1 TaxID=1070896 RepID=UPI000C2BCACA|nr:hypothetical protein [Microbacterium sp. BR1]
MIPDWAVIIPDVTLLQGVLWIVAVVVLIGVVIKLWPFISNAVAIVNALVTLPSMAKQVSSIHHELHPNGGTSMNDSLRRVEAGVKRLDNTSDRLERGVKGLYQKVAALAEEDERLAAADEQLRKDIQDTQPNTKEQ